MKKIFTLITAIFTFSGFSQSILLTNNGTAATFAPNQIVNLTTTAGTNTNITIDIKNTSGTSKSYNAKRYDVTLNANGTSTAAAYFCFAGTCFGAPTYSAGPITLNAGESASQLSGSYNMLIADLDEASTVGYSLVKYTFINANLPSDSVQISLRYNFVTGIAKTSNIVSSLDISPNPVNENSVVRINSTQPAEGKLMIINALGAVIREKSVSLEEGKNKVTLESAGLAPGVYFASLKFGNSGTSKKFIVGN